MNAAVTPRTIAELCPNQTRKQSPFYSSKLGMSDIDGNKEIKSSSPKGLFHIKADPPGFRPDFIIIGAAKCATTSIYMHLRRHAKLNMSKPKETNFFSWDEHYQRGWSWYEQCFSRTDMSYKSGEASPTYSDRVSWPTTVRRIASAIPEVKIVYVVRNPLERTASHWRMLTRDCAYTPSFQKALKQKEYRPFLQERSKYWFQINAYRDFFPDDRIKVVFFEDFKEDPLSTLNELMDFIGVEHFTNINNRILNHGEKRSKGRSEKRALHRLRQLPLMDMAKNITPQPIKKAIWQLPFFTRKQEIRTPWTRELREQLADEIGEDARAFLEFYGKPRLYWKM